MAVGVTYVVLEREGIKMMINGKSYRVKRSAGERYVEMSVDDLRSGMRLDQGTYVSREETEHRGQINPLTWLIRLEGGTAYVESRSAQRVRVWI